MRRLVNKALTLYLVFCYKNIPHERSYTTNYNARLKDDLYIERQLNFGGEVTSVHIFCMILVYVKLYSEERKPMPVQKPVFQLFGKRMGLGKLKPIKNLPNKIYRMKLKQADGTACLIGKEEDFYCSRRKADSVLSCQFQQLMPNDRK